MPLGLKFQQGWETGSSAVMPSRSRVSAAVRHVAAQEQRSTMEHALTSFRFHLGLRTLCCFSLVKDLNLPRSVDSASLNLPFVLICLYDMPASFQRTSNSSRSYAENGRLKMRGAASDPDALFVLDDLLLALKLPFDCVGEM